MDGNGSNSNSCSSSSANGSALMAPLQPLSPKSPPGGVDLYGKRRHMVKVQILEREIAMLQEELKSVEGLQPASRCCKELDNFIEAKPDPLVAINHEKTLKSCCRWKKLCCPWICCFSGCACGSPREKPKCSACCSSREFHSEACCCLEKMGCGSCCKLSTCLCRRSNLLCCNWLKVLHCSNCLKTCLKLCCV